MITAVRKRPKHLDLTKIRLPLPGIVSILHRVSGAALFLLGIPFGLAALQGSLGSAQGFDDWAGIIGHTLVKVITIGFAWAFMHHFFAGIRYLFLDVHKGTDLKTARLTSQIVIVLGLLSTLLIAIKLW